MGSGVVAHRFSCSMAHGIFLDQGLNIALFLALAGRFLTTRPPGKPQGFALIEYSETCRYENACHEGRNLYSQISRRTSVGQEAEEGQSMA